MHPSRARVTVIRGSDLNERHTRIVLSEEGFELREGGVVIATSSTPQALSAYALDHGAVEVRHDYDLKLGETC